MGQTKEKKLGTCVLFICPKHTDKGVQKKDWSHLKNYTYGCAYCSGRYKTTEEIQKEVKNPDVELISEYLGNEKPIFCKCRKCGNEWKTLPKVLITNGSGCPKCGRIKANKSESKKHEDFVKQLFLINPNIEVIGKYIKSHGKVRCQCKIDGYIWDAIPSNLLNLSAGCPYCNMSLGEQCLINALSELNISYISQYPIKINGYKRYFRFDAFCPDYDTAIEFNGMQHYYPVSFSGDKSLKMKNYLIVKKRDRLKINYCEKHNINLVIIPYWEKQNIKQILINIFNRKELL